MKDNDDIKNPIDGSPLFRQLLSISGILAIILILYVVQRSRNTNEKRSDLIFSADREAPVGWVVFKAYSDNTFEYSRSSRGSDKYQGTFNVSGDTLFLFCNDETIGIDTAIIRGKSVEFLGKKSPRFASITVNHITDVSSMQKVDTIKTISVQGSAEKGKKLYWLHCRQCHAPVDIQPEQGLGLRYVFDRLPQPSATFFKDFVGDSKKLKNDQIPYALKLEAESKVDYEHRFKDSLSSEEFDHLIAYIKDYSKPIVVP